VSVKHTFVYLLIIFELVTYFNPAESSSGLYANQVMLKKTAYIFGIPLMFTKDIYIYNGSYHRHESLYISFVNINWITKMYAV